ncbi:GNAT family protein, partial [Paenibacillus sp. JTLBN-2024]
GSSKRNRRLCIQTTEIKPHICPTLGEKTPPPASGKVMEKLGMKYEGTLRQHVLKNGEYDDLVYYGLLKDEWRNRRGFDRNGERAASSYTET